MLGLLVLLHIHYDVLFPNDLIEARSLNKVPLMEVSDFGIYRGWGGGGSMCMIDMYLITNG